MNSKITGIVDVDCTLFNEKAKVKTRMLEACKKKELPLIDIKDDKSRSGKIMVEFSMVTTDKIEAMNQLQIIVGKLYEEGFTSDHITDYSRQPKALNPRIENYRLA